MIRNLGCAAELISSFKRKAGERGLELGQTFLGLSPSEEQEEKDAPPAEPFRSGPAPRKGSNYGAHGYIYQLTGTQL